MKTQVRDERGRFISARAIPAPVEREPLFSDEEVQEALREMSYLTPIQKALLKQRKAFLWHYKVWLVTTITAVLLEFFIAQLLVRA